MKAAFTRAYNKEVHLTPYSLQVVKKGRRGGGGGESELAGEDGENVVVQESEDEEEEGLQKDAMIKVGPPARDSQPEASIRSLVAVCQLCAFPPEQQKKSKATKEAKKEAKEDSGKGKGKGKGKSAGRGGSKGTSRGK